MAAEKPAAKIRRNFFAFIFRTAAEKILFFYFSDIRDKLLRTQKRFSHHFVVKFTNICAYIYDFFAFM